MTEHETAVRDYPDQLADHLTLYAKTDHATLIGHLQADPIGHGLSRDEFPMSRTTAENRHRDLHTAEQPKGTLGYTEAGTVASYAPGVEPPGGRVVIGPARDERKEAAALEYLRARYRDEVRESAGRIQARLRYVLEYLDDGDSKAIAMAAQYAGDIPPLTGKITADLAALKAIAETADIFTTPG